MGASCRKADTVSKSQAQNKNTEATQKGSEEHYNINVIDEKKGSQSKISYRRTARPESSVSVQDRMRMSNQKLIGMRQTRLDDDAQKLEALQNKLQLIKDRKYESANIKEQNAFFEMVKIEQQIELFKQRIQKRKLEKRNLESKIQELEGR